MRTSEKAGWTRVYSRRLVRHFKSDGFAPEINKEAEVERSCFWGIALYLQNPMEDS